MDTHINDSAPSLPDRCRQTALFLWWMRPDWSSTTLVVIIGVMIMYLYASLLFSEGDMNSRLHDIVKQADEKVGERIEARTGVLENQSTYSYWEKDRWRALAKKHKRAAITAMTPDEMRNVAGLLVMYTAILFLLYPLVCFILCLLVNSITFCTQSGGVSYPDDLAYMLCIMVPGYLVWNYLVVILWADVLAVVLGKEKEKEEGEYLCQLQRQVAFCVQPALTMMFWMGAWIYGVVVRNVEDGMVKASAAIVGRSQVGRQRGGRNNVDQKG